MAQIDQPPAEPRPQSIPRTGLAERVIFAAIAMIVIVGAAALWTEHGGAVFIALAQAAWALCF